MLLYYRNMLKNVVFSVIKSTIQQSVKIFKNTVAIHTHNICSVFRIQEITANVIITLP